MNRLNVIPRFAIPYGFQDFWTCVSTLFDTHLPWPDGFDKILGGGSKFWASSGRQALWLILKGLQLSLGTRVAVPLCGDTGVAKAIFQAGYTPVFLDVEEETLTVKPHALAAARREIGAAVVVHLFGHVARMDQLSDAAAGIPVIEDTVEAPLSFLDGRMAGTFGVASFYSFASSKCWPAGGGGLAVVNDPDLAARVREETRSLVAPARWRGLSNALGQMAKAVTFRPAFYGTLGIATRGWAERHSFLEPVLDLNQIQPGQAAVALCQGLRFVGRLERLRANSLYLLSLLSQVEDIILPNERPGARYNFHLFPVLVRSFEERAAVARGMLRRGVDTSLIHCDAVQKARELGYRGGCPIAESVASRLLTLPNHADLSTSQVERVAGAFIEALNVFRSGKVQRQWAPLPPVSQSRTSIVKSRSDSEVRRALTGLRHEHPAEELYMPLCGTTGDESYSPPREGCRGGLFEPAGPTPKATPSTPPQRGFSQERK